MNLTYLELLGEDVIKSDEFAKKNKYLFKLSDR